MNIDDNQILQIAKEAIRDRIVDRFTTSWSSPIQNMANDVVASHADELKEMMEECLRLITKDKSFKDIIKDEFRHKVAKNLVGKLEGIVTKSVDKLNNDPTIKARMILAIEDIIKQ